MLKWQRLQPPSGFDSPGSVKRSLSTAIQEIFDSGRWSLLRRLPLRCAKCRASEADGLIRGLALGFIVAMPAKVRDVHSILRLEIHLEQLC